MFQLKSSLRRLTKKRDEQGFSLIELMVVVLIIGILVGIAVLAFGGAANNSRDRSAQANLRNVVSVAAVVSSNTSAGLPSMTAAAVNNATNGGEANLVSATALTGNTSQRVYSTTAGVFCANGNANTFIVTFVGSETIRTQAALNTCTAAAAGTASTWGV